MRYRGFTAIIRPTLYVRPEENMERLLYYVNLHHTSYKTVDFYYQAPKGSNLDRRYIYEVDNPDKLNRELFEREVDKFIKEMLSYHYRCVGELISGI